MIRERADAIDKDEDLPFRQLVETCCKAYQHALGEEEPVWPPDDDLLSSFQETIESLLAQIEGANETPWAELAKFGYTGFATRMRVETEWEDAPPKIRTAWEATVRHLANAYLNFTSEDDLASHEARWRDWTNQKLQRV